MRDAFALRPEIAGAGLLALAGLTLTSFAASDGVFLRWALLLVELTGWGYYLVWLAFAYLGVWLIRRFGLENRAERWEKPAGVVVVLLTLLVGFDLVQPGSGGWVGSLARLLLGDGAAWLVLPIGLTASIILLGPWGARDTAFLAGQGIEDILRRYYQPVPVNIPALPAKIAPAPLRIASTAVALPVIADLLTAGSGEPPNHAQAREHARRIEAILAGQSVPAAVREINVGPVVTQFAVEPGYTGAGANRRRVPVRKFVGLADELALGLAASPIRIETPIPGRPYVGIEVPNPIRRAVAVRDVLEATPAGSAARLFIPLGQGADGRMVSIDLAEQPHLLIAGTTGSGKSVCLNAAIAGLLCRHSPASLRLLLIDPKRVELAPYDGLPHLLAPVAVNLDQALEALTWLAGEMERRYALLAEAGARNISVYNAGRAGKLPFIVTVIDELSDLMLASTSAEMLLVRPAQKARAVGIHLMAATQRPSADVITGLLKANFPARIAFTTSSQTDSRVILDTAGAEKLLGKGDLLYRSPASAGLQRLQGAHISEADLARLINFWRRQPASRPEITPARAEAEPSGEDGAGSLFDRAATLVRSKGRATVSMLQREFGIGYTRASRLMDELEAGGVVGPAPAGNRAREVIAAPAEGG